MNESNLVDFSEMGQFRRRAQVMSPADQRSWVKRYRTWLQDPGIEAEFEAMYEERIRILIQLLGER